MEIASNKGVIADASTPAGRAGMSESEWREAIKFDSTDTGWVIMRGNRLSGFRKPFIIENSDECQMRELRR